MAGSVDALRQPDTMFFEDSEREKLGGLNLGSVREVNGRRVQVGGFTWGLSPLGTASYAFAEYDLARSLLNVASDQTNFVMIGVAPGADLRAVQASLEAELPDMKVMTTAQFRASTLRYVLTRTPVGAISAAAALFGLFAGFVIVGLAMFSAVVGNVREFGTLKAVGATTKDLAKLLWVQATLYPSLGSLIGFVVMTSLSTAIHTPKLALSLLPPGLMLGTFVVIVVMCIAASSIALLRVRKVEPAMAARKARGPAIST